MPYLEESLDLTIKETLAVMQNRIVNHTMYFGVRTVKNPLDFWVYQELMFRLRPDVIIEIGNFCGGSTLALAHQCDLLNKGKVIGLDISHSRIPDVVRQHPRITLIEGDACESLDKVKALIAPKDHVLIIEDSSHTYENTLNIMRAYHSLVPIGGYLIIEDSNCHHGVDDGPSPGPYEAIETFMDGNQNFVIDRSQESFLITWNPKGFLKRVA